MRRHILAGAIALTLASLAVAGAFASQSGVRFASVHSSAVIDPCSTTVPTDTTTPEATPTDTATPEATATDTATPDPAATDTSTPEPTATCAPNPTATATDVPATETSTPAPTDTPGATDTPQPTATGTPSATETPGPTETATPGTGGCDDADDDTQNDDSGGVNASPTAIGSPTASCQNELGEGCEHSHSGDTPAADHSGTPVPCTNPHNDRAHGGQEQNNSHHTDETNGDSGSGDN